MASGLPRSAVLRTAFVLVCLVLALSSLSAIVQGPDICSLAYAGPGETVRVGLLIGVKTVAAGATRSYQVLDRRSGTPVADGSAWSALSLTFDSGCVRVGDHGSYPGGVLVKPGSSSGFVTVNGLQYRGVLEVVVSGGGLLVINEVEMEDYLAGVVPREMYTSWPVEALKAQAVAARTYAYSQVQASRAAGSLYAVTATTSSQVYGGVAAEHPATNAAVAETRGLILTHGGQPISAVYHSSSGGHTEDSENVWAGGRPYLRGVPDYDQMSPKYNWTSSMTPDEVAYRLAQAGHNIGTILGIEPSGGKGVSGRWIAASFTGTNGSVVLKGEDVRRVLGLHSTLFDVEFVGSGVADLVAHVATGTQVAVAGAVGGQPVVAMRAAGTNYSIGPEGVLYRMDTVTAIYRANAAGRVDFVGHGWGHGVGMSQWGAYQMASDGKTFDEILGHYYQGVVLEQR